MNHLPLLAYIALFSAMVPIYFGFFNIRKVNGGMLLLFFYLIVTFILDVALNWVTMNLLIRHIINHSFFLVEYIFIICMIAAWQETHWMKRFFQLLTLSYILFWIIAKLTFEPLSVLYTDTAITSQVILALSAGYTLFIVIGNRGQSLVRDYRFWVLLSFVIYFAGTLLVIALRGILLGYSREILFLVNSIDWSLKILFNFLFAIAFLCLQTQTKTVLEK